MAEKPTTEQKRKAMQSLVKAKLRLWNAADRVEKLFNRDIDSNSESLENLCVGLSNQAEVSSVSYSQLTRACLGK